jgi:hypothetical protein
MMAQKLREEAVQKERDEHFITIRLVIPMRQEWRVKEKTDAPPPMTSSNEIELLDDDESPLINDGSPVVKQRQAPVHTEPSGFCFITIFTL